MRKKARVILHVSKVMFVERQQVGQGLCQVIVYLSIHPWIAGALRGWSRAPEPPGGIVPALHHVGKNGL